MAILPKFLREEIMDLFDKGHTNQQIFEKISSRSDLPDDVLMRCIGSLKGKNTLRTRKRSEQAQLIEEIRDAWVNIGRATNKPEMVAAVPDPLDLKILLETIYFASIEYEEGVRVKVRVVLYPDTTLKTLFYHAP
jgi:hypothetical protein